MIQIVFLFLCINVLSYTVFLLLKNDFLNLISHFRKKCKAFITVIINFFIGIKIQNKVEPLKKEPKLFIKRKSLTSLNTDFSVSDLWQILVYHVQDIKILSVEFQGSTSEIRIFSLEKSIRTVMGSLLKMQAIFPGDMCIRYMKLTSQMLFQLSTVPLIVVSFLIIYFVVHIITMVVPNFDKRAWKGRLALGVLLLIMYANQKVTATLLSLLECVPIHNKHHLFIYANIECYQAWQYVIIIHIFFVTLPQCLVFLLAPPLLFKKTIRLWHFIAALFLPTPFTFYWIYLIYTSRTNPTLKAPNQIQKCSKDTTINILDEIYFPFDNKKVAHFICWMGLIEIRRLGLILGRIFISDSTRSLVTLIFICFAAFIANIVTKPYKSWILNNVSAISILSQVIIVIMSFFIMLMNLMSKDILQYHLFSLQQVLYVKDLFSAILPIMLSVFICLLELLRKAYHARKRKFVVLLTREGGTEFENQHNVAKYSSKSSRHKDQSYFHKLVETKI